MRLMLIVFMNTRDNTGEQTLTVSKNTGENTGVLTLTVSKSTGILTLTVSADHLKEYRRTNADRL